MNKTTARRLTKSQKAVLLQVREDVLAALKPPPRETVDEWAEKFRFVPPSTSSRGGRWKSREVPYMIEPMRHFSNAHTRRIAIMSGAQVAKTEAMLNCMFYSAHRKPAGMILIKDKKENAEDFSKHRISRSIEHSPVLRGIFQENISTVKNKTFDGGQLYIGSPVPGDISERPCRFIFGDELDRWPVSAGQEGDPWKLLLRRAATFWDYKAMAVSTPTLKATSRIYKLYMSYKRMHFEVSCPHCNEYIEYLWDQFYWENENPDTACYVCQECGKKITDKQKNGLLKNWRYKDLDPDKSIEYVSFYISGVFSRAVTFKEVVREYLDSKNDTMALRHFYNTYLGLPYEEKAKDVDDKGLMSRRETYAADLPKEVVLLTCAVDLQKDRAEFNWVGWGERRKAFAVLHSVVEGDPQTEKFFNDIASELGREFKHELGPTVKTDYAVIDTGGSYTKRVHEWLFERRDLPIFGIKGRGGWDCDVFSATWGKLADARRVKIFLLAVDQLKLLFYNCLAEEDRQASNYIHFPDKKWCNEEYFKQATGEALVVEYRAGQPIMRWTKKPHRRVEILDTWVYNFGLLEMINPSWEALSLRLKQRIDLFEGDPGNGQLEPGEGEFFGSTGNISFADSWRVWGRGSFY